MKWRLYRIVMKLAHRFNWHYAPEIGPTEPGGDYQRWCKWCGFRAISRRGGDFKRVSEAGMVKAPIEYRDATARGLQDRITHPFAVRVRSKISKLVNW